MAVTEVAMSLKAPTSLATRDNQPITENSYRSCFMRDRDRVLYSKAFRRLAGKTQVYIAGGDSHIRTRLTHTLEVSQIARTISQQLKLDCDLTEAIALGHDIGHTPYGHAGERTLHSLMIEGLQTESGDPIRIPPKHCGFKHNLQSVATSIQSEKNYENSGLRLTNFTLYGMLHHSSTVYKDGNAELLGYYKQYDNLLKMHNGNDAWSFESFVVREADEIAQRHHDLEDAVRGNLITMEEITKQIKTYFPDYLLTQEDRLCLSRLDTANDKEVFIAYLAKFVVNMYVSRIIATSTENLNQLIERKGISEDSFADFVLNTDPSTVENVISYDILQQGALPDNSLTDTITFEEAADKFKAFISEHVLSSYDIQKADSKGQYIIRKIYRALTTSPRQLPNHCIIEYMKQINAYENWEQKRLQVGMGNIRRQIERYLESPLPVENTLILRRVVCNYIAGMTDNYAKQIFDDLYK